MAYARSRQLRWDEHLHLNSYSSQHIWLDLRIHLSYTRKRRAQVSDARGPPLTEYSLELTGIVSRDIREMRSIGLNGLEASGRQANMRNWTGVFEHAPPIQVVPLFG